MNILEQQPQFVVNYQVGSIGFIATEASFVEKGIAWETRWDAIDHVPVIHTFIITGEDSTIEAFSDGVGVGTLSAYLNDPKTSLLVRGPISYSPAMGQSIVSVAQTKLGDKYNFKLIAADAVTGSVAGHYLNLLLGGRLADLIGKIANTPHEEICSQLVAICLEAQPELQAFGVLSNPPETITPVQLFEDAYIFQPGAFELVPPTNQADTPIVWAK